jgi:Mce-associated membrane protein
MTTVHEQQTRPDAPRRGRGLSTGAGWALTGVLALLLVVGVAGVGWGMTELDESRENLETRADVARVAEQFTAQVNEYDAGSVDEYKTSVSRLLSTKFRAEFDQAMEDIVASVQQAEMRSRGEVLASGVATVDPDSARVLVVADAEVETVFDTRQRHFRWEVSLVKVDGRWLVDDFEPVTDGAA